MVEEEAAAGERLAEQRRAEELKGRGVFEDAAPILAALSPEDQQRLMRRFVALGLRLLRGALRDQRRE